MSASQYHFDGKYSAAGLTDGLISTLLVGKYLPIDESRGRFSGGNYGPKLLYVQIIIVINQEEESSKKNHRTKIWDSPEISSL